MDINTRRKINDIVDTIIKVLDVKIPIDDINCLITSLNGAVEIKETSQFPSSKIRRHGDGFIIEVAANKDTNRQNFIIAHELGHLFLHMGYLIDEDMWDKYREKECFKRDLGEMEYQAHEFASALFMPREKFFNLMNENYCGDGEYDIEKVSEYFKVSLDAAKNRGKWLGVLAWG